MLKCFELKGDGGMSISIHLHAAPSELTEERDRYHPALVCVELNGYSAVQDVHLTRRQVLSYLAEIEETARRLGGIVTFDELEERAQFTVECSPNGQVLVKGKLERHDGSYAALDFTFGSDQSYLSNSVIWR